MVNGTYIYTHFIANHRKVQCDICAKSFNTPGALRKHRYTHMEEKSQYKCRTCSKIFPFESQLKSHRHMHRRSHNYISDLQIVGNHLNIQGT